jgi:murein DD-endopeptidase MepM/ murein hydrolase activator NlpD
MRAGTVLKVPGAASTPASAATAPAALPPAAAAAPSAETAPSAGTGVASRPTIINNRSAPAERVAAVTPSSPTASDATQPADTAIKGSPAPVKAAAAGPGKFRWPAKGRVIASFGPRGDNTHNDGINILVPQGTDVHAAEAGVVAYAGSELKGYGNLVLIRHNGNWVSAYAHNEQLLVKRGDKVTRGQAIAKAGKTGAVDQPQVHFELRQGSKPVDPMPHLEQ